MPEHTPYPLRDARRLILFATSIGTICISLPVLWLAIVTPPTLGVIEHLTQKLKPYFISLNSGKSREQREHFIVCIQIILRESLPTFVI